MAEARSGMAIKQAEDSATESTEVKEKNSYEQLFYLCVLCGSNRHLLLRAVAVSCLAEDAFGGFHDCF